MSLAATAAWRGVSSHRMTVVGTIDAIETSRFDDGYHS
jgi:hypothetical protein